MIASSIVMSKKNKAAVGFELGLHYSQLSFSLLGNKSPETFSFTTGGQDFLFETALAKKKGENRWYVGVEAVRLKQEKAAELYINPFEMALKKEPLKVGEEELDPDALLALFIRRALIPLQVHFPLETIDTAVITVDTDNEDTIKTVERAVLLTELSYINIRVTGNRESFFGYVRNQELPSGSGESALFRFDRDVVEGYWLFINKNTVPKVSFCEKISMECGGILKHRFGKHFDEDPDEVDIGFMNAAARCLEGKKPEYIFLIGEGFEGEWEKETFKYLCKGRRVFMGNNLYSKGACHLALELANAYGDRERIIFLDEDRLLANVGIRTVKAGVNGYRVLLDGGNRWKELTAEAEFIIRDSISFSLVIEPLTGEKKRELEISLDGLADRKPPVTRVRLRATMTSRDCLRLELEDLGFGEISPAGDGVCVREVTL